MTRVVRVKASPDSANWPVVFTYKDPTREWDEYEGMYVYPTIKAAERFCLANVNVTRLHYYVISPISERLIAEYHPNPIQIAPQGTPTADRRVSR